MAFEDHPLVLAADTTDYQANTLSRIGRAATYGTGAALASGALSIYNSFVFESAEIDTEQAVRKYGGDAMGNYYVENKEAIDLVGLIGTSIVPASLGIKGVKLARSGLPAGNFKTFLNASSSGKEKYLKAALQETAANGGVVKNMLSANRLKFVGWEIADQALLGTAAELAVVATMHDSPVFEGDSLSDFAWNVTLGAGLSAGIGGLIGGVAAKGILNKASDAISSQMRTADVIKDSSKLGLMPGSETMAMAESIVMLPTNFEKLPFTYKFEGVETQLALDTPAAAQRARESATRYGLDQLKLSFNKLAGDDAIRGQAYYEFLVGRAQADLAAGKPPQEVVNTMRGYLANMQRVEAVNMEQMNLDARKFYLTLKPAGDTPELKFTNLVNKKFQPGITTKQAYRLADDLEVGDLNLVKQSDTAFTSQKEFFRNNPDVDALQLPDGSLRVNPLSTKIIRHAENPYQVRQLIDLESGDIVSDAPAVVGDMLRKGLMSSQDDAIYINNVRYAQPAVQKFDAAMSPLEGSARWAWASTLDIGRFLRVTKGTVDSSDLPMLSRLAELVETKVITEESLAARITIRSGDGETQLADLGSLRSYLETRRMEVLEEALASWDVSRGSVPNTSMLAANLNTDRRWVEAAIERHFAPYEAGEEVIGKALDTAASLKPRTVQATWNFGVAEKMAPLDAYYMNMGPNHLIANELRVAEQTAVRSLINKNAMTAVLGKDAELFLDSADDMVRTATPKGAGASVFGASNAGGIYDTSKAVVWAQDTGKNVSAVSLRNTDAIVGTLAPSVNGIRANPAAGAELSALTTALRKHPDRFVFTTDLDDFGSVRSNTIVTEKAAKLAVVEGISEADAAARLTLMDQRPHMFEITDSSVLEFVQQSVTHNHTRQGKFTTLRNAAGLSTRLADRPVVYVPPVDTTRYPYHAFVRSKEKVGVGSSVTMITAKSADQLRDLAAKVGDDFDVLYDRNTDDYFKAKGEYDYAETLNEAGINSHLARKGALADFFPETRAENVLEDWLIWHKRQEEKLVREAVQVGHRQFFSEMQHLSNQYRTVEESVTRGIGSLFKKKVQDPYGDYIKTALDISKQQEFPLLDSLNEFVDKVGLKAGEAKDKAFRDAFLQAKTPDGKVFSWEDANKVLDKYGLGAPYKDMDTYITANERYPKNLIRTGFQKINMALATTMLRWDAANSIVNLASMPILATSELAFIRNQLKNDANGLGALNELLTQAVPGKPGVAVPSTLKLFFRAANSFFGPNKEALMQRYRDIGTIKTVSQQYHQMMDMATYIPGEGASGLAAKADKIVELGAKITGNTLVEDLTRFMASEVMRQATEPLVVRGKMTIKEQNAWISNYVNRTQGNYVTSQRPVLFQGTTGAAVSLFQTFAFNVLQQLNRYMEAGDKKTLAIFAGMQSTIFGLNGLPFFDAINTHIIGTGLANNPEHKDAYSVLPKIDKELGDWMLYGTASAFPLFTGSQPALFTRGDLNPRHMLILPTAIADVPAVSASLKLVDTMLSFGKNVKAGADISDSLFLALQHQGWSRPLAGFGQLLAGQSVDSKGALISAANEMQGTSYLANLVDRTVSMEGVTRLMGARPMDEALAINAMYRNKGYQAVDRARIERLGTVVRTKLYNGDLPTDEELEDFMLRYTRSGGRIENFNAAMARWQRDANVSVVNQMARKQDSHYAQTLRVLMGGELPDYSNAPDPVDSTGME